MSDTTCTLPEFVAKLDALDDEDLIDFLGNLDDRPPETVQNWDEKRALTVDVIQRRPFARFIAPEDGDTVTEDACLWAMARHAVWGDLAPEGLA